ncbi:MAG: hypothetical protein ABI539_15890 [Acidobacteriota bacterium]
MAIPNRDDAADRLRFLSSHTRSIWHEKKAADLYERWYFDALSDDGTQALTIIFSDDLKPDAALGRSTLTGRTPFVSFAYYLDGKLAFGCDREFEERQFKAQTGRHECRIGESGFAFDRIEYGSGYLLNVDLPLAGGRHIEASLEWLSLESDLLDIDTTVGSRWWNMVAPRSDVSGRISVFGKTDENPVQFHFRGTGYHDHLIDRRGYGAQPAERSWGRSHFTDATAVFYLFRNTVDDSIRSGLKVVKDGQLRSYTTQCEETHFVRDRSGVRYPARLTFSSADNTQLVVKHAQVLESHSCFLRALSEVTLTLSDGERRSSQGINEFRAPKAPGNRWMNWLNDRRSGRKGKSSLAPRQND